MPTGQKEYLLSGTFPQCNRTEDEKLKLLKCFCIYYKICLPCKKKKKAFINRKEDWTVYLRNKLRKYFLKMCPSFQETRETSVLGQ